MNPTVAQVEKLLRAAGIDTSTPGQVRERARRRWLRRLRNRALLLLLILLLALFLVLRFTTGTATDPVTFPTALQRVSWYGTVDPRMGIEEAFRAPAAAATVPIGWERIPFFWSELQQNGPGSWNYFATNHDQQIDQQVREHRQVVGLLINTPAWAAAQPALHGDSPPKGLYLPYNDPRNYWGHFVGLIARRYAGRIDDWIIWNEVTIHSGQWKTWGGSEADYIQLLKVAYLAATAANPRAKIILAGDPYWYDHGAFFSSLLRTLHGDAQARANHYYFDAVNLHLYSSPLQTIPVVQWYRATMARYGVSKPIWIAETNVVPYDDTVRLYPRGGLRATQDEQASYIVQDFALAMALGIQRIEVNRMLDGTDFAAGGEPFGLMRNDGTARPALAAYRTAATLFAGVTGGTISANTSSGIMSVRLQRPGTVITVVWDQRPTPVSLTIPANAQTLVFDKFGQQVPLRVQAGHATLSLAGATGNTDLAHPQVYVIGGNPLVLVQPE